MSAGLLRRPAFSFVPELRFLTLISLRDGRPSLHAKTLSAVSVDHSRADGPAMIEMFRQLRAPVARVGAPLTPVPFSTPLETGFLRGPETIFQAANALMQASDGA